MYLALVGCSIFKNEIDFLKPRVTSKIDYYWLPQRLHNKPLELRKLIQEEIRAIDNTGNPYEAIILIYGLCSKGIVGIYSEKYPLVIPKVQDCIAILLGSNDRYRKHFKEKPGTYWFTRGWVETGFTPGKPSRYRGVWDPYVEKFREYREKFDETLSRYLIAEWDQRWIKNYTTLAFIDWGIKGSDKFRKKAEENACNLGLEFENMSGDPLLLLNFLNGAWDNDTYLRAEPGQKIVPSYTDDILTCIGSSADAGYDEADLSVGIRKDFGKRGGLGLGIDAGGTYTDTVLYDFTHERVLAWSKAMTTHDNYALGIENALNNLLSQVPETTAGKIGLISLSTTLATNAIVEGKGGRVGLILIGYDRYSLRRINLKPSIVIRGKHSIEGELIEPLDPVEAREAVNNLLEQGIDAFAVSSEVGVRNPEYEIQVKDLILNLTNLPVVCGSELTTEINCVKRANTCYFNARLIPLVTHLLSSVKDVLARNHLTAPIMVVKGDGTLMSEQVAKTRPIEMILSGPAASVIGGAYLSKVRDGWVVDMGGTTTDAAVVRDGFVAFKEEGINIDGFRTAVRTVDVHTFGLGGDSYVKFNYRTGEISIGPERVVPISYLADVHPDVLLDLKRKKGSSNGEEILVQPADYFLFQKDVKAGLHPQEKAIMKTLKEHGPLGRTELARRVKAAGVSLLRTERLERFGNIIRSALTPTDILRAADRISLWNREAARRAISLYAERAGMKSTEFMETSLREFYRYLLFQLFTFLFKDEDGIKDEAAVSHDISHHLFSSRENINIGIRLNKPLVFIGAPAKSYSKGMAGFIDIDIRVPEYSEVANAVGAITGAIRESVSILIRPEEGKGFTAFTSTEKLHFRSLNQAKREMAQLARITVAERAQRAGASNISVHVKVEDKKVSLSEDDEIYLETVITASVSSVPVMKE